MLRLIRTRSRLSLAAALCVAVLSAASSAAQAMTEADLAALRYFLAIGDQSSVDAETRRLQEEFPDADIEGMLAEITRLSNEVDTTDIWRLIANDSFSEARALIERERQANPGWVPPEDMMSVLAEREGQLLFDLALENNDVSRALELVGQFPELLTCGRINNAWRLAALQAEIGRNAAAITSYSGILSSCNTREFVVATLQKAAPITDSASFAELFRLARNNNPALAGRLATLEDELRPNIGKGADFAASGGDADGAAPPVGNTKVTDVTANTPPPLRPTNLGIARPSTNTNTGGGGGGSNVSTAKAAADRGDWATCLQLTNNARTVAARSQRAWCALNADRPLEAVRLFQSVLQNGGQIGRDAAYGAVLAYIKVGMVDEALLLTRRVRLTPDQRRTTDVLIMTRLAESSFQQKRYRDTIQYIDRLSKLGGLDRGLAMLRGFALLNAGRRGEALRQFEIVHKRSPGQDTLRAIGQIRASGG